MIKGSPDGIKEEVYGEIMEWPYPDRANGNGSRRARVQRQQDNNYDHSADSKQPASAFEPAQVTAVR
jgi:hypothetical protein